MEIIMGRKNRTLLMLDILKSDHIVLAPKDLGKVLAIFVSQVTLSILDFLGVIILGLVGTISFNGIQGGESTGLARNLLKFFGLSEFSFQIQVSILAATAVMLLIFKTILSIYFKY
jgi:hypothetical protein